ncbi:hypothetical protein AY599_16780 [Leptolyngbya valderiana BDU 20041]|nr:hypothetical protein [Geitlerinema sp. CS-897]OAB61249.1 hypothetical protein AY599_16780 [Leptolyngbya valderiana BDU 20041]PPT06595.1 hypothetical protein CKA32_003046 [Geitlerinema sp. FC II]
MSQPIFVFALTAIGSLTLVGRVAAQQPQAIELDDTISTRVEDLYLDEISTTPDRGQSTYPELREDVGYRGVIFEPVTIELNNPENLPQDQSSQFNLRVPLTNEGNGD